VNRKLVVALVIVCLVSTGCRDRTNETAVDTDTISPATGPTTTDAVTTQTIDVADTDRSGAEGEGATEPDTAPTTTTTAPTTATPP
jgi:hypothetical protein